MKASALAAVFLWSASAFAHPMGNFSVNHYARLEPGARGLTVTYVLDLAELPTTELIQSWGVDRDSPRAVMEAQAAAQARQWAANLKVTENGKPILGVLERSDLATENGAANLPIYRIRGKIRFLAKGGRVDFEDGNYATRAGWREIVVRAAPGAELQKASVGADERSEELTLYPKDQEKAPPQDSKAWLEWRMTAKPAPAPAPTSSTTPVVPAPVATPAPAPEPKAAPQIEPGHEYGTIALLVALAGVLYLARRLSRNRYPVS